MDPILQVVGEQRIEMSERKTILVLGRHQIASKRQTRNSRKLPPPLQSQRDRNPHRAGPAQLGFLHQSSPEVLCGESGGQNVVPF